MTRYMITKEKTFPTALAGFYTYTLCKRFLWWWLAINWAIAKTDAEGIESLRTEKNKPGVDVIMKWQE